jgi:hypothetical protein
MPTLRRHSRYRVTDYGLPVLGRAGAVPVRRPTPAAARRYHQNLYHAPVAQLDRASVYGTEGRGFESLRAHSETSAFAGVFAFKPPLVLPDANGLLRTLGEKAGPTTCFSPRVVGCRIWRLRRKVATACENRLQMNSRIRVWVFGSCLSDRGRGHRGGRELAGWVEISTLHIAATAHDAIRWHVFRDDGTCGNY